MATWAERRDQYMLAEQERRRAENKRNALSRIFAESTDPDQTLATGVSTDFTEAQPFKVNVQQQTVPGKVNIQNALSRMYREGFAPEAMQLEQQISDRGLRRMQLGQRPSAVQVYEYYQSLPSDKEREEMLRTMRSAQYGDIGGVRSEMPVLPGKPARPLGTLSHEAGAQAAIEAAKARAAAKAKADVEVETEKDKKATKAEGMIDMLNQADNLLNSASGGLTGLAASGGKRALNISDEATKANQQLKLISGWLVSNVPRMEGPQSNFDVKNYEIMAGVVGDISVPIGDRKAAIAKLIEIQNRYAHLNRDGNAPNAKSPKAKLGDSVKGPDGRTHRVLSLKPDGTPDDVQLVK